MHDHIPPVVLALIACGYVVISFQFYLAAKGTEDSHGRRSLALLLGIFVLCALAGYVPRLIGLPGWFEVAVHVLLAALTWWFILTNQAAHIMRSLR